MKQCVLWMLSLCFVIGFLDAFQFAVPLARRTFQCNANTQSFDLCRRSDFPNIIRDNSLIYLDSAASTQLPKVVTDGIAAYYRGSHANVHRSGHSFSALATEEYEGARRKMQKFLNAKLASEIIFTSGATYALNLVAHGWGRSLLAPGDEIVLSVMEHHSNLLPWQRIASETGAIIRMVPLNSSMEFDLSEFISMLNSKTKMVSITHVSNVLGITNPLNVISQIVRSICPQAMILIDACQSASHHSIDTQAIDVDFLVLSGHKMCGPTGIGVLYGKESALETLQPLCLGGGMVHTVGSDIDRAAYYPLPHRLEAGTPPIAQAVGLGVAADYLVDSVDMVQAHKYVASLGQYLYNGISRIPRCVIYGPVTRSSGIVSFNHEKIHPADLAAMLDSSGVAVRAGHHCAQPLLRHLVPKGEHIGCLRASAYIYNTFEEIDKFLNLLEDAISIFDR